jgi:hypothetical protein
MLMVSNFVSKLSRMTHRMCCLIQILPNTLGTVCPQTIRRREMPMSLSLQEELAQTVNP